MHKTFFQAVQFQVENSWHSWTLVHTAIVMLFTLHFWRVQFPCWFLKMNTYTVIHMTVCNVDACVDVYILIVNIARHAATHIQVCTGLYARLLKVSSHDLLLFFFWIQLNCSVNLFFIWKVVYKHFCWYNNYYSSVSEILPFVEEANTAYGACESKESYYQSCREFGIR